MSYVAANPEAYEGKKVGSGQCVAYVQIAANAPGTGTWKEGIKVIGSQPGTIAKGTVIATFVNGHYPNLSTGNHAAIYLSHDSAGIKVLDQWSGHPVTPRLISPHGGQGSASNDADAFSVVE
ncbi:MAG: BPSL0067 family protein [Planctomycetes bacterium]|jgi:hypothetical protein|nr:BPSL0067 family protein [Planctomycetota bacterium]